jgi:Tfp pilus assembly protein PilX
MGGGIVKTNRSGMALVTVMCFTLIVALAVAYVMKSTGTNIIIAQKQMDFEKAQFVAEAGAEHACSHIAHDGTVPTAFSGLMGDGVYCVTIVNGSTPTNAEHSIGGRININPNNSPDNQFTVTLATGGTITRAMLVDSYGGYTGIATAVHVKPKGNGNQNELIVNGEPYDLENKNTYDITSPSMAINIFNDNVNKQGKAVGKWYIAIATTESVITISP